MWAELSKKPSFDAYLEMIGKQVDDMRRDGSTYAQGKAAFESMPWPFGPGQGVSVHVAPPPFEPGKWPYAGPPTSRYDQMKEENARLREENARLKAEIAKLRASGGPAKWPRTHVDERGEPIVNSQWMLNNIPCKVVALGGEGGLYGARYVVYDRPGLAGTVLARGLGEFLNGQFSPILA